MAHAVSLFSTFFFFSRCVVPLHSACLFCLLSSLVLICPCVSLLLVPVFGNTSWLFLFGSQFISSCCSPFYVPPRRFLILPGRLHFIPAISPFCRGVGTQTPGSICVIGFRVPPSLALTYSNLRTNPCGSFCPYWFIPVTKAKSCEPKCCLEARDLNH